MFYSAHHALKFAFRTLGMPIVKMSSVNSMRGAGGSGDMTPHDRHAQAAMIMAIVERTVDVHGQAFLRAYYGREHEAGEYKRELLNHLVKVVIGGLPSGMHYPRGVEKLIINYFGGSVGMSAVRQDMHCGITKANEYRDTVRFTLDNIWKRTEHEIDNALRSAGVISEDVAGS